MYDSKYIKLKKVYTNENGGSILFDKNITFDGLEYFFYVYDKDEDNVAIYIGDEEFDEKEYNVVTLKTYLEQHGYSDEEFKNPFNRTKKIVKTIDYENSKIKNKVKQK